MQKFDEKYQIDLLGNDKHGRFNLLVSPGCVASIFTKKMFATKTSGVMSNGSNKWLQQMVNNKMSNDRSISPAVNKIIVQTDDSQKSYRQKVSLCGQ